MCQWSEKRFGNDVITEVSYCIIRLVICCITIKYWDKISLVSGRGPKCRHGPELPGTLVCRISIMTGNILMATVGTVLSAPARRGTQWPVIFHYSSTLFVISLFVGIRDTTAAFLALYISPLIILSTCWTPPFSKAGTNLPIDFLELQLHTAANGIGRE